ncbi:MAG: hypothetical protein M3Q73_04435 [bacterium]|nr:hypothetical protein [bacterium]
MTYTNGDVRTGNFVNSKREGEFIRVAKSGNMYREQFADDVRISSEKIN